MRSAVTIVLSLALSIALVRPLSADQTKKPAPSAPSAPAAPAASPSKTIQMAVTDKGFEPANLTVKKGEPVTLAITRKTAKTCATEIVIDEEGVNTKLPLNQEVKVTFTPKKAGTLKFGCAMGKMIGGVLKVE
jgi:plastocyanin domain-containing protein